MTVLRDFSRQIVIKQPAAGEQVAIDLNLQVSRRLAFDLAGAVITISDGRMLLALSNGGVLVLSGNLVDLFLTGQGSLDAVLSAIHGTSPSQDRAEQVENTGASFRYPSPEIPLGPSLRHAGVLLGTTLTYAFPESASKQEDIPLRELIVGTSTSTNHPAVAINDTFATGKDSVLAGSVLANDSDVDDDQLRAILTLGPVHGDLVLNADGSFIYTPDVDYIGPDNFSYLVNDGTSNSNIATVAIEVGTANSAPAAANDSYDINEDGTLIVTKLGVLANDTDIDGDKLTAALVNGPAHGALTLRPNGEFTYTPAVNFNGTDTFTYSANDGNLDSAPATVTISVAGVNDAPSGADFVNGGAIAENSPNGAAVGTVSASDPDFGDNITYSLTDNAGGRFAIDPNTGAITVSNTALLDFESSTGHNVTVVADDGKLTSSTTLVIGVTNVNEVPTDIALSSATVAENAAGAVIGTVSVADPDAGDNHSFSVSDVRFEVIGGQLQLRAGGSLNFETEPTVSIDITATDKGALVRTETFVIGVTNVNETPTDIVLSGATVPENAAGAVIGTVSVTDPDAVDTYSFSVSDTRFEVVGGQLQLKTNVGLDFETAATVSIDITAIDKGGLVRTETFAIGVTNVNEAPTDIVLSSATVAENASGAVIGSVSVTDPDVGDTHSFSVSDGRFEVVGGQLRLKSGLSLDFETDPTVSIDITANDKGGLIRTETFVIGATDVNETPTDILLSGATVAENAVSAVIGTVTVADPDVGDTHGFGVSDVRFEVVGSQLQLKAGVSLDFETDPTVSIDITAIDKGGLVRTETFVIGVTNANEVPTDIALAGATVAENDAGAVIGTLTASDPDAGDTLGFGFSDVRFEVVANQLKLKTGVSLDFETNPTVSIDVTATDNGGLIRTETFVINVTNVNDPPVAADDSASVTEDGVLNGVTVLANDSDLHGGVLGENNLPLTAVLMAGVSNGNLIFNPDGTYIYTPTPNFNGTDTFTYQAEDSLGGFSNTATVVINVVPEPMVLVGDPTANKLTGGNGDDTITGLPGDDILSGGAGKDFIDAGTDNDQVDGGSGDDTLLGDTGNDIVTGGAGNDSADGGTGDDLVNGGDGDDALDGETGDDFVIGGSGNDTAAGGTGSDKIDGGDGDDTLAGDEGFDLLVGGSGSDTLRGGTDNDILSWDPTDKLADGGTDIDTLLVSTGDLKLGSANVLSIENIDLGASNGPNTLTLTAAAVIALSDTDILVVAGGAGDNLQAGTGWVDGGVAGNFHIYTQAGASLVVDIAINVNADILI